MNQDQYRSRCEYRRRGHIVETRTIDGWEAVNLDSFEHMAKQPTAHTPWTHGKGVNRAKRFVRSLHGPGNTFTPMNGRCYAEHGK